ncbi:MAG: polysaccharide biosynthesis/export family protein [Paludibacteraceae bacterium]|nr:polysaccharide biosynthesis/export family protein [Paludibacteraceae bacterium]
MQSIKTYLIGLVGIVLGLSSCVTSRKVNYLQEPDKKIPHYADTIDFSEYKIRTNDRLYIYVYSLNEEVMKMYNSSTYGSGANGRAQMEHSMGQNGRGTYELYSYLVDTAGCIDFPTLGKIPVRGLTTRETKVKMEQELASLLKELPGYSTISVEVNVVQRSYSLIGVKSGRFPIEREKLTIFEALAQMGNLQEFSDRSRVKIIREINGETMIREFDLRSKDIINSEFYYIEPNDIIYVREMSGKAFGINSAATGLAVVSTTLSFGVFVYTIVATGINHVNKYKK